MRPALALPPPWALALACLTLAALPGCYLAHGLEGGPDASRRRDASDPPDLDAGRPDASRRRDARPPDPVDGGPIDGGACASGPPVEACTPACGNGVREGCGPFEPDGCCAGDGLEVCDGADLGGASCAAAGYASGALRCGADCRLDPRSCSFCRPDRRVTACRSLEETDLSAESLAMIVQANGIFLAWVETSRPGYPGGVRVARYDLELNLVAGPTCLDLADARRVALAEAGGGALLAVERAEALDLLLLDSEARIEGRGASFPDGAGPLLEALPADLGGGGLLVWGTWSGPGQALYASRIDARGEELWRTPLHDSFLELEYGSVAFTGDGFLVAVRADRGAEVTRVELDGAVGESTVVEAHGDTEYPQIVWAERSARLTYSDFRGTGRVMWAPFDRDGRRLESSRELGRIPTYFNIAPMVARGESVFVLFGTYTGLTGHGEQLLLRGVGPTGGTEVEDFSIELAPGYVRDYRVAALPSGELITAWISVGPPNLIGLARIRP